MVPLMKHNLCRHDSYGNQYPGQGTPPTGSYPNQQPGMYQQQQVTFPFILDSVFRSHLNVPFHFSEAFYYFDIDIIYVYEIGKNKRLPLFLSCRVTNVPLTGFILRPNVMRQSTAGPSMADNNRHSSNSSRVWLQLPLQDSRKHTISSVAAAPILVPIAVHLVRAISSRLPSAVSVCRERQGPMLSQTCPLI